MKTGDLIKIALLTPILGVATEGGGKPVKKDDKLETKVPETPSRMEDDEEAEENPLAVALTEYIKANFQLIKLLQSQGRYQDVIEPLENILAEDKPENLALMGQKRGKDLLPVIMQKAVTTLVNIHLRLGNRNEARRVAEKGLNAAKSTNAKGAARKFASLVKKTQQPPLSKAAEENLRTMIDRLGEMFT